MMRDGKASIMFLARAFAAINGFTFAIASFFNPVLAYACFQRLMFAFGLASVIRLSQRLGVSLPDVILSNVSNTSGKGSLLKSMIKTNYVFDSLDLELSSN